MILAAEQLGQQIGVAAACRSLQVVRSRLYRSRQPQAETRPRPTPSRALSAAERVEVREVLNSEQYQDLAPRQIYASLLDEGRYLCHWRTMYRILAEHQEVKERRNQRRHPTYIKPELLATGPNQLWSWDITQLRGPDKWLYFYLYVIVDVFSRYVVGWLIAEQESADLAHLLIAESCTKQNIEQGQLTLHADNGKPMKAKVVTQLLVDLGINKSHSRPHVSDDNPFSEAHFKTLKYRPDYPDRFRDPTHARQWGQSVFSWYNQQHYHSALGLLTPASVHYGQADLIVVQRQQLLQTVYMLHPERFVKGQPVVPQPPQEVWINPPKPDIVLLH
jgi:putative transposase